MAIAIVVMVITRQSRRTMRWQWRLLTMVLTVAAAAGVAAVVVAVAAMIDADGATATEASCQFLVASEAFDTDDCHHGNGNASLRPDRTSESLNSFHWLSDDFGQGASSRRTLREEFADFSFREWPTRET